MDLEDVVTSSKEQLEVDMLAPVWRARESSRLNPLSRCRKTLRTLDAFHREHPPDQLNDWADCNSREAVSGRPMTTSGLSEVANSDWVEIGAHSVDHPTLPERNTARTQLEVSQSETHLETWLGIPVRHFVYRNGAFDDECRHLVRRTGYETAWETNFPRSPMAAVASERYALPRRGMSADGVAVLKQVIVDSQ